MSILDITVVSVALETFQREFDATSAQVAWTMTGYTLALASVIPLTGWAADRFGTKRLYLLAVGLFTAGSVLCAAADSLSMLVLFRVLQGLGGRISGGWLIDAASWHWIFLINLPIGIGALAYATVVLPKDNVEPSETFDWLGMLLLSPGLASDPVATVGH
jgi:MFS family permease